MFQWTKEGREEGEWVADIPQFYVWLKPLSLPVFDSSIEKLREYIDDILWIALGTKV